MNHVEWKGTHGQAGWELGSLLSARHHLILEHIPFAVTAERLAYAADCLAVYRAYFPEILEELEGLAEGQHCDVRLLQAVLFSTYAMPPSCHCSCFAAASEQGVVFGRNSDFLTEREADNTNVLYRLTDGGCSFTGNTTSFLQIEDGVNEHGLAVGLTSVAPTVRKPGFNAGLLVRYCLERCKTVPEALGCLQRLPVGSAQTLTLTDTAGRLAVVGGGMQRGRAGGDTLLPDGQGICLRGQYIPQPCHAAIPLPAGGRLVCGQALSDDAQGAGRGGDDAGFLFCPGAAVGPVRLSLSVRPPHRQRHGLVGDL